MWLVISQKVVDNSSKRIPGIWFQRIHRINRISILHGLSDVRAIKHTLFDFLWAEAWECFPDVFETLTSLIKRFYKLFHQSQFDVKWREDNFVSWYKRRTNNILFSNFHLCSKWPIFSIPTLVSSSTVPQTQKVRQLCVARLPTKQMVHHFKVNTNNPVIFGVIDYFHHLLNGLMCLLQCRGVSNGYQCVGVGVVLENTFQTLLCAVDKQTPWICIIVLTSKQKGYYFEFFKSNDPLRTFCSDILCCIFNKQYISTMHVHFRRLHWVVVLWNLIPSNDTDISKNVCNFI